MALHIITHCYSYLRNITHNGEELSNRMDYLDLCQINYAILAEFDGQDEDCNDMFN